ncbi:hypothetical protein [Brevibacillus sp. HD1.4A]|uniref:hypothetical protein n=1 Tax=Brevibacillus sp. HD1.4A TaxID=2738978 RepID=UPI00156B5B62|nr:hypothetical protein [Brevibacillus sp. HD1.4A]NRQ56064.1 hypothetical protein [Brevibacillus sp. HD1.4A]
MPYIDFKSVVKKVNLKPGGKKEIVLEVSDNGLDGKLDSLSEMIDCKVDVSMESLIVNYNVTINAKTNEPLKTYKVDDKGVVSEIKPQGEQIEADLGLPQEKVPTKEQTEQAELEVIDEFITSGMSPSYDDLPYDFQSIIKRKYEGETYMKMASELGISSGKIVELVDEYRKRVAPLAMKWNEWRQGKDKAEPQNGKAEAIGDNPQPEAKKENDGDSEQGNDSQSTGGSDDSDGAAASVDKEALEQFILSGQAPIFADIPFDFPSLLKRKLAGETWMQIANSIGESSTKMQSAWSKYKKLVAEHMAKSNNDGEQGAA